MTTTIIILAVLFPLTAMAQTPIPKTGSNCPSGYTESGGYCTPMRQDAPPAIVKQGQCPSGWTQSGSSYCVRMR